MAGTKYLNIIATLQDKATKVAEQVERQFNRLEKQLDRTGAQWKRYGKDVEQFGNQLTFAGAAITGPFLLALHNSAQYSIRVSEQIDRMKNAGNQFQLTLANALVPILERFTNALGYLLARWNALDAVTRDHIVQTVFMTGVYLTLSGVFVGITGRVIKFTGEVMKLTASFVGFAAAHPVLLMIVGAIGLMILYWDKLKVVAVPVLNTLEIGVRVLAAGFLEAISLISRAMADLIDKFPKVINFLAAIGSPLAIIIKKTQQGNENLADSFRKISQDAWEASNRIGNFQSILTTGRGSLVTMSESAAGFIDKMRQLMAVVSNPPKINIEPVVAAFNGMQAMAQGTAQAMTSSLADGFFNVITGKFNELGNVAANFGRMILQTLTQVMAKMFLLKTVGAFFPGLGKFFHQGGMVMHSGGMIQRAHNGMLANDEVPIIAQTGEAVLSRKGVSTLGPENVYRLNRGQGVGQGGQQIIVQQPIVIKAWDMADVRNHEKEIIAIFAKASRQNSRMLSESLRRNG